MCEKEISEKMQEIMSRIKSRREELDMSYQTLSDKVGISKSTLQRYETGYIKNMPVDKLEDIASALNVSPAYLMGWEIETVSMKDHNEHQLCRLSRYMNLITNEIDKMNQIGKAKLLDTAREMNCNPLYNDNYQEELKAAHQRTDIEITEDMVKHDDDIMNDDNF